MDKYEKVIESFGKRVKRLRREHGFSQEGFALEAEIDRSYFGRIERGQANPTLLNIASIANALGISIAELFPETRKSGRRRSG